MKLKNDLQDATRIWVTAVKKYYEKSPDRGKLTQCFLRGYFAGWSERDVAALADKLAESEEKFPCYREDPLEPGQLKIVSKVTRVVDHAATGEAARREREAAEISADALSYYMGWLEEEYLKLEAGEVSWNRAVAKRWNKALDEAKRNKTLFRRQG